jgi:hypothetical protein
MYSAIASELCGDHGCPQGHLGMWWRIMLAGSGALLTSSGVFGLVNASRRAPHHELAGRVARGLFILSVVVFVVWLDLHYQVTNQTGP